MNQDNTPAQNQRRGPSALQAPLVCGWQALLLLAWLVTAIANRDTLAYLDHVTGAWIALGQWANQGTYYPPLEAEGYFGGTRFGPLAIAMQALAQRVIGDPIVGPKLLHGVYMAALIGGLWVLLRPLRLPTHLRLLFATLPLVTWIGWSASLSIRHDTLATALQVWAMVALFHKGKPTPQGAAIAALLGALAALSKITALWGGAVCLFYLVWAAPRLLAVFVPVGFAVLGGGLGLAEWQSAGGFSENMRACLFAGDSAAGGLSLQSLMKSGYRFAKIVAFEPVLWALLPLSLLGAWHARRLAPQLLAACLLVWVMTAYLVTRPGIDANHLIDLVVVSVLATALWLAQRYDASSTEQGQSELPGPGLRTAMPFALVLLSLACFLMPMKLGSAPLKRAKDVAAAAGDLSGVSPITPAHEHVLNQLKPGEQVVSYYPMVPVLLGDVPVVLDSWMQRIYFESHPESEAAFVQRIEAQEFDAFVFGIRVGPELDFDDLHFGAKALQAVRDHYELVDVQAYSVFRPIRRGGGGAPK